MCRLLTVLTPIKDPRVFNAVKQHMQELERDNGGMGNGIYLPHTQEIVRSFDIKQIQQVATAPFMFHTRIATGPNVTVDNCHPFEYKNTVLTHNGWVTDQRLIEPRINADSKNLLHVWKDNNIHLRNLPWTGNIITFDKTDRKVRFTVNKHESLQKYTLNDGTVLVTSGLHNPSTYDALNPFIAKVEEMPIGDYEGEFGSPIIKSTTPTRDITYQFIRHKSREPVMSYFEDEDTLPYFGEVPIADEVMSEAEYADTVEHQPIYVPKVIGVQDIAKPKPRSLPPPHPRSRSTIAKFFERVQGKFSKLPEEHKDPAWKKKRDLSQYPTI